MKASGFLERRSLARCSLSLAAGCWSSSPPETRGEDEIEADQGQTLNPGRLAIVRDDRPPGGSQRQRNDDADAELPNQAGVTSR